ncbi:MAG: aminotransferase class V-fold PLP-dependent enzyme [Anaerolineae bacterium]|nr:aminotransferase class V-fold PLP-dependent enzyme [Anaerolineae bacterium]
MLCWPRPPPPGRGRSSKGIWGAIVILDGYHAAGIVPFDVTALNVDFYLGGVLKWMCGGPGGVFLYARPDYLKTIRPRLTGWMAHKRPFAFEVDEIDFRDDAFRFLNGTPAIPRSTPTSRALTSSPRSASRPFAASPCARRRC